MGVTPSSLNYFLWSLTSEKRSREKKIFFPKRFPEARDYGGALLKIVLRTS
jgi:hypothetical protein